jgi:hypothetical protein
MKMTNEFIDFVRQQTAIASADTAGAMSAEQDKQRWLTKLAELGKSVDGWLSAYRQMGIKTATKTVSVSEEEIGTYQAPQVEITVGPSVVKLKPIGTFLIGAWGRVDMEGPRGICRFILVPKAARAVLLPVGTEPSPTQVNSPDLVWKIMPTPPATDYVELNGEVFRNMLMKVVRGG